MSETDAEQPAPEAHEPSEISYDEQRYPARPRRLRPKARLRDLFTIGPRAEITGKPRGDNPAYVGWLVERSMLEDAKRFATQFSGQGSMWQNPFANPDPRAAIQKSSVWFTAYPISMITKPGTSFLGTLGDESLWAAFEAIGIDGVHTGPVKKAGGLVGWDQSPSVDGHFDRISNAIDEAFGTEEEFRSMCEVAAGHLGTVIDDIVPGHTGKGSDFRLAEMKVGDYPGVYHMVEIEPKDWHLLPAVTKGDSINLDLEAEDQLAKHGYIIGRMQRVIFYEPGVKDTNWSATAPVLGPDGMERRWVFLHYFKEGQPSINWLDPSFAGMRLVIGDALHSLGDLGSGALRLDANGFLGVEKSAEDSPAWSEGHPLSEAANQLIASMVRKVGGFTFQELNLTIDDIQSSAERGADLSYDFINRPAYHHALATGDTEFVRLTLDLSKQHGVEPASLVHALQNHDEMTYELVHFETLHARDLFRFHSHELTGHELAVTIRQDLLDHLTGDAAPYNATFTQNGIASTTATIIAASLGFRSIAKLSANKWSRSSRRTCCWSCSTRCSRESSPCLVGTFAGCSPWTASTSAGCSRMAIPAGSTARRTTSWTTGLMPTSRCPRCPVASACTARCPHSCRTAPRLSADSPRFWPCGSATGSRQAFSSMCRMSPTRRCWSWCTSSPSPEASAPRPWCQAVCWSTCSVMRRSARSTTCTLSRSPSHRMRVSRCWCSVPVIIWWWPTRRLPTGPAYEATPADVPRRPLLILVGADAYDSHSALSASQRV
jgi:trehalose synthase